LQRLERIVRSVIFFCLETKGKYWNVKFKSEEINLTMKKDFQDSRISNHNKAGEENCKICWNNYYSGLETKGKGKTSLECEVV
jgi:hypothetical protein